MEGIVTIEDSGAPSSDSEDRWDLENAEMRPAVKDRSGGCIRALG